MTKFMSKTFSVPVGDSPAYRDNYDAVFGRRKRAEDAVAKPLPRQPVVADTAEALLTEALTYVRAGIKVTDGPAERLAKRIKAYLEGRRG